MYLIIRVGEIMLTVKQIHDKNYETVYELTNSKGLRVLTSPFGARLLAIQVPLKEELRDIVAAPKDLALQKELRYFGATIGPVAGRITNSQFTIDGQTYTTETNNNAHTLHSGSNGFDTKDWLAETFEQEGKVGVIYSFTHPDGADGFPGEVQAKVIYTLDEEDNLKMTYEAKTDKATLYNPTCHGYYNLTGSEGNPVNSHLLQVGAEKKATTNPDVTTTGEFTKVAGTKFDFRTLKEIGETTLDDPFVLHHDNDYDLTITSPDQAVSMQIKTDSDAIILYITGTHEEGTPMKNGTMVARGSIAIEPQGIPGAEKFSQYGSILLRPEETFHSETTYHIAY